MKANPVREKAQGQGNSEPSRQGSQYGQTGQGSQYGQNGQTIFLPSEQRNNQANTGQAISRLPTYSETILSKQQNYDNIYPPKQTIEKYPYNPLYSQPSNTKSSSNPQLSYLPRPNRQSRIVNFGTEEQFNTVWRQCWANPYEAEQSGCSVQKYRGEWYNMCR